MSSTAGVAEGGGETMETGEDMLGKFSSEVGGRDGSKGCTEWE